MDSRRVQWSNLPNDLLSTIGKRLDTHIDILRFRSVCKSWRSSVPSFNHKFSCLPFYLPYPIHVQSDSYNKKPRFHFTLTQSTIYLIKPTEENLKPGSTRSWLANIEEFKQCKIHLLNPLSSSYKFTHFKKTFPKVLNLMDFKIFELSKAYLLTFVSEDYIQGVNKAVFAPNTAWTSMEECAVLVIFGEGKLAICKYGDEKWTLINNDDEYSCYTDIIFYKGQFHVVDQRGTVSVIDSSLKLREIWERNKGYGRKKQFVESCGDLYMINRIISTDKRTWYQPNENKAHYLVKDYNRRIGAYDFAVYKLNEETNDWDMVRSLGDRVFFVGDECSFSVSAQEFPGCEGNCIYFTDRNYHEIDDDDVLRVFRNTGVFNLDGRIVQVTSFPGDAKMLWPPPTWLKSNSSSCG